MPPTITSFLTEELPTALLPPPPPPPKWKICILPMDDGPWDMYSGIENYRIAHAIYLNNKMKYANFILVREEETC